MRDIECHNKDKTFRTSSQDEKSAPHYEAVKMFQIIYIHDDEVVACITNKQHFLNELMVEDANDEKQNGNEIKLLAYMQPVSFHFQKTAEIAILNERLLV